MTTLVHVHKDGESLRVHPDALAEHQKLGWQVHADQSDPDDKPAKKGKKADGDAEGEGGAPE